MDKRMLKITITQLRQIALFAVGMSLLTACGNSQSGMKLGDAEFAVMAVNSTTSDPNNILSGYHQRYAGYRSPSSSFWIYREIMCG